MADGTAIEWTDASWNPIRGCTRVSEGCRHCYAETVAARWSGPGQPYEGLASFVDRPGRAREARWTGDVRLIDAHLRDPLRWQRPRKVFVNSMSDLFHEGVPDLWIDRIFAVMALAPRHSFQILTKRPQRMRDYMTSLTLARLIAATNDLPADPIAAPDWPLPNVWLGVSIEDQAAADARVPILLQTPAAVRFVSAEPLLGPIDLTALHWTDEDAEIRYDALTAEAWVENSTSASAYTNQADGNTRLDWVIAGGESGPQARPMHPGWPRELRDQCADAGVAFFFQQWGEWHPAAEHDAAGCPRLETPEVIHRSGERELRPAEAFRLVTASDLGWAAVCRLGKKRAGRTLDGRTHDDFPTASHGGSLA